MFDREIFKDGLRFGIPNITEQELDERTDFMEKKYGTIKRGDNVVHLEYFGGLINNNDISEIETILSKSNLELSRFDKNGVPYASLEDFILQVSLLVNELTSHEIILGLGTNALWDTIKKTTFYVWQKVRNSTSLQSNNQKKINCGISISLDKKTKIDFKISGEFTDELAMEALDKVLDFLKTVKPNETIKRAEFVVYNKDKNKWEIIDTDTEFRKLIIAQKEKDKRKLGDRKKGNH